MILRNCDLKTFIGRTSGKKIVCFGAGRMINDFIRNFPNYSLEKHVSFFVDNNNELWGTQKLLLGRNIPIESPQKLFSEADEETVVLITADIPAQEIYTFLEANDNLKYIPCYLSAAVWAQESDKVNASAPGPPASWRMNETPVIPKKIHYIWFGNNQIPEKYQRFIKDWRRFCPDYEFILWNERNYDVMKHPFMKNAYETGNFAFIGDYARLDIVYEHGGIYLDVDVELLRSLDELLYNDAYFGFQDSYFVNPGHGFGAKKGFPLISKLRDAYDEVPSFLANGSFNLKPSPDYQTKTLEKCGLRHDGSFQIIHGAAIYPARYLSAKNLTNNLIFSNDDTYSIHHFAWSWNSKKHHEARKELLQLIDWANKNEKAAIKECPQ